MKKFKFKRKKDPFPKSSDVRVKNSYYTFSKEYPAAKIIQTKRVKRKKERVRSFLRVALAAASFLLIVCVSFFAVDLGLRFSNKPIDTGSEFSGLSKESSENLFKSSSLKALYMPYEKLSNGKSVSSFIKEVKKKDCTAVVIDFKTESGKLVYSSQTELARSGKCAIFDNETVKTALGIFEREGIDVVARFFCFEDKTASEAEPSFAVKYKDTDVLWRDDISEGKGKTWLNPYSTGAVNYLLDLIKEVSSMGVKGFLLEAVSFPDSDLSTTGFPGEKSESGRADALLKFVKKAKAAVPESCFLLLSESASDILLSGDETYSAELLKSEADGVCVDTKNRPESFVADRKSNYSSMLSMFSQIKSKQNSDGVFVPVIDIDEYRGKYIRTLSGNGYSSYIIFDESGKY